MCLNINLRHGLFYILISLILPDGTNCYDMIPFYKYHGAGNDFILIDNRNRFFDPTDQRMIQHMCHRRFGIGADGLMLLQDHTSYAFEMKYYNADGLEGTMCGNGGRCIAKFAHDLGIIDKKTEFLGVDGSHKVEIQENELVKLALHDVKKYETINNDFFLDTGSPHYVIFTETLNEKMVLETGGEIRLERNCNVNFVKEEPGQLVVRTYERGVEDETFACGTGIVASSLAHAIKTGAGAPIKVQAIGGRLEVFFERKNNTFQNIWLTGGAVFVFKGTI